MWEEVVPKLPRILMVTITLSEPSNKAHSFVSSSGYHFPDKKLQPSKDLATKVRDHHAITLEKPLPHRSGRYMDLGCGPTYQPTILLRGKSASENTNKSMIRPTEIKSLPV